jgi:hypothetical protein
MARYHEGPNVERQYSVSDQTWTHETTAEAHMSRAPEYGTLGEFLRGGSREHGVSGVSSLARRAFSMLSGHGRQAVIDDHNERKVERLGRWGVLSQDVYDSLRHTRAAFNGKVKKLQLTETATRFEHEGMYFPGGHLLSAGSTVVPIDHDQVATLFPQVELDSRTRYYAGFFVDYDNARRADGYLKEYRKLPKTPLTSRTGEYEAIGMSVGVKTVRVGENMFTSLEDRSITRGDVSAAGQMDEIMSLAKRVEDTADRVNRHGLRRF